MALTPEQIAALRDACEELAGPLNAWLLKDIAERVAAAGGMTSTAAYEVYRTRALGESKAELKKYLREQLKLTRREVRRLFRQAARFSHDQDFRRLGVWRKGYSESFQQTVAAAAKLAGQELTNLTRTLGMVDPYGKPLPLQRAYRSAMNFAFEQVFSGAADMHTAVHLATRKMAAQGVRVIDYESGVHTGLEAAVRRNMLGGLGLMVEQVTQQTHDALGCNGWEISAHGNSAPDHEPIQGRQYSDEEYIILNNSLARRIGTLNCGHHAFPVILGVNAPQYTAAELEKFRTDNERGITYEGRHYTGYEATQKQRQLERAMRVQKNRILMAEATGDGARLQAAQIRLRRLNEEYRRFSKAAGLRTRAERAQVAGFGPAQAARANAAAKTVKAEDQRLYDLDRTRRARLQEHPELALPHAESAVIQDEKFTKYLFNIENQRGYAKGVAFKRRLGYDVDSWKELQAEIRTRASLYPVRKTGDRGHGMTYEQKMILYGRTGRPTNVVVSWIEENEIPRMTSAYIKEVKINDD